MMKRDMNLGSLSLNCPNPKRSDTCFTKIPPKWGSGGEEMFGEPRYIKTFPSPLCMGRTLPNTGPESFLLSSAPQLGAGGQSPSWYEANPPAQTL